MLPPGIPRLAVEAGATAGWRAYVGAHDDPHAAVVGMDTFGESAPATALFPHFGFTVDAVAAAARTPRVIDGDCNMRFPPYIGAWS